MRVLEMNHIKKHFGDLEVLKVDIAPWNKYDSSNDIVM